MARTLEQERLAFEQEERRLAEWRDRLAERARDEAIKAVDRSGLLKLDGPRLDGIVERIRKLGIDEVEKRLAV